MLEYSNGMAAKWMVDVKAIGRTSSLVWYKVSRYFSLLPNITVLTHTLRKSLLILLLSRLLEPNEAFVVVRKTSKAASRFRLDSAKEPHQYCTSPTTTSADVSNGKRQLILHPLLEVMVHGSLLFFITVTASLSPVPSIVNRCWQWISPPRPRTMHNLHTAPNLHGCFIVHYK
jgi:hypothetical protein